MSDINFSIITEESSELEKTMDAKDINSSTSVSTKGSKSKSIYRSKTQAVGREADDTLSMMSTNSTKGVKKTDDLPGAMKFLQDW